MCVKEICTVKKGIRKKIRSILIFFLKLLTHFPPGPIDRLTQIIRESGHREVVINYDNFIHFGCLILQLYLLI